jgi:hypothetical protein
VTPVIVVAVLAVLVVSAWLLEKANPATPWDDGSGERR